MFRLLRWFQLLYAHWRYGKCEVLCGDGGRYYLPEETQRSIVLKMVSSINELPFVDNCWIGVRHNKNAMEVQIEVRIAYSAVHPKNKIHVALHRISEDVLGILGQKEGQLFFDGGMYNVTRAEEEVIW